MCICSQVMLFKLVFRVFFYVEHVRVRVRCYLLVSSTHVWSVTSSRIDFAWRIKAMVCRVLSRFQVIHVENFHSVSFIWIKVLVIRVTSQHRWRLFLFLLVLLLSYCIFYWLSAYSNLVFILNLHRYWLLVVRHHDWRVCWILVFLQRLHLPKFPSTCFRSEYCLFPLFASI
jgi:hypothetical protein